MHVPAPLPAGGAPQRPCASVPLTPALSPKRAVAAPLQATDHLSNPAPTALPTAARGGSARMDGTAWRVGTGGGALQVRPPNGRGRGEQTSPPHGGGERRFRATGACRLQLRQAECFFNTVLKYCRANGGTTRVRILIVKIIDYSYRQLDSRPPRRPPPCVAPPPPRRRAPPHT
jgi:hypothetical protein